MTRHYEFDETQRIWISPGAKTLPYSDGDESEEYLLSVITNAKDISANSLEIISAIKDWSSEYHLSPIRHNLLRPFSFGPSDRILELGCGCGSMTRYLGESGAMVVSVEGSRRRAAIAAERCRDLPNVSVYCDNLINFQMNEDFNFVTLIGVVEYSQQFISDPDPVRACLEKAGGFLTKEGSLVLAIENQLGLKYFNGCSEDHTGKPYFGINGLYSKSGPVTLGRHALAKKLSESGFPVYDVFYPFPDYKLPGLILSNRALGDNRLNVADLLIHNAGRDYPETYHRAFAEDLAWCVMVENNLLADLTNSFLVLARTKSSNVTSENWLAKIYSRGQRHPRYQVESTIEVDNGGSLTVRKRNVYTESVADEAWLSHVATGSVYIPGRLLIGKIHKAMALEARIDELAVCFKPWLDFLLANATRNTKNELMLPGNFVDCIPANMIEIHQGGLQYFDAEWVSKEDIPMAWIVIRGVAYSLIGCLENETLKHTTYRQFIADVAKHSSVHLSETDFAVADNWEAKLVAQCQTNASTTPRLSTFYDEPLFLIFRLSGHVPELRLQLARHEAEIARIKLTISWRITAPLRVIWNFFHQLMPKKSR